MTCILAMQEIHLYRCTQFRVIAVKYGIKLIPVPIRRHIPVPSPARPAGEFTTQIKIPYFSGFVAFSEEAQLKVAQTAVKDIHPCAENFSNPNPFFFKRPRSLQNVLP